MLLHRSRRGFGSGGFPFNKKTCQPEANVKNSEHKRGQLPNGTFIGSLKFYPKFHLPTNGFDPPTASDFRMDKME
jgi:hypothetical protein